MSKTQLLKYNYNSSEEIKNKYYLAWPTEYFKYLGVMISKDLAELFELNRLFSDINIIK